MREATLAACRRGCQTARVADWHSPIESANYGGYAVPRTSSTWSWSSPWRGGTPRASTRHLPASFAAPSQSSTPSARVHGAMVSNVADVDIEGFQALLTPIGQAILAEAADADVSEAGLLTTASRLRSRHPAGLVAAALTQ